jgi:hypothetical protein
VFTEDFFIQFFEKSEATKCLQLFNELITAPLTELDSEQYELFVPLISEIEQEYNRLQDEYALPIVGSLLHIFLTNYYVKNHSRLYNYKIENIYLSLSNCKPWWKPIAWRQRK